MRIALSTSGAAAQYTVGTPYTLPATSLDAVLSADTLATLRSVGGLVLPDKTYPVETWVTIAATNTTEGVQTVRAASTYTPTAGLGPVVLPETTWTPTGAGPIRFSLAAPGSASAAGATLPYGSVFLSLGTEGAPATLDCAPAAIAIANAAIPWSDAGRNGSAGRYAIEANPSRPVFASRGQQPAAAGRDADAHRDGEPGARSRRRARPARRDARAHRDAHAAGREGARGADRLDAADRLTRRADRAPAGLPAGLLDLPRHDRRDERRRRSSSASAPRSSR